MTAYPTPASTQTAPTEPVSAPHSASTSRITQGQALAEIAALTRIEHPWGPCLRDDLRRVLARVQPSEAEDAVVQIGTVLSNLAPEPCPLTDEALAQWRADRSCALTDVETILGCGR